MRADAEMKGYFILLAVDCINYSLGFNPVNLHLSHWIVHRQTHSQKQGYTPKSYREAGETRTCHHTRLG